MKHSIFPVASLAMVLVACAHDRSNQHTDDIANAEQRAEARSESNASLDESASESAGGAHVEPVEADRRRAESDQGAGSGVAREQSTGRVPDNTGVNERDRNSAHPTPMDQGNGEVDLDMTQRIRKAVMADDSLSFTAKNAKIITRDGQVTLRGPVKSAAEKDAIYKCAVSAAGVGRVINELEVAAN